MSLAVFHYRLSGCLDTQNAFPARMASYTYTSVHAYTLPLLTKRPRFRTKLLFLVMTANRDLG
jgi:hypothetical protein